jgi:hypothetical protein
MNTFRVWKALPVPIIIATVLATFSVMWLALFSLGAFSDLGMPFFQAVGLPMQAGVIFFGLFLMTKYFRNRPESAIRFVPIPIRVLIPLAVAVAVLQLVRMPDLIPSVSPAGNPVHSFDASVEGGVCTALYNQVEKSTQSLAYCASYQSHFNRVFASAWLLFSSLELWGAWAAYGGPVVQRVQPDRRSTKGMVNPQEIKNGDARSRPTRPRLWLAVRAGVLVYFMVGGWQGFKETASFPGWVFLFALFWGAVATRFGINQAYTSAKRTEAWLMPSWYLNPFQRSQPYQFFHLAGLGFLLFGVAGLLHRTIRGDQLSLYHLPTELFAGAFGLGILAGIYWAIFAYRSRFQRVMMR